MLTARHLYFAFSDCGAFSVCAGLCGPVFGYPYPGPQPLRSHGFGVGLGRGSRFLGSEAVRFELGRVEGSLLFTLSRLMWYGYLPCSPQQVKAQFGWGSEMKTICCGVEKFASHTTDLNIE